MPKIVVRRSSPGCEEVAMSKVAVPWHYVPLTELKTYGYACSTHVDSVAAAQRRLNSLHLAPDESVGEIHSVVLLGRRD